MADVECKHLPEVREDGATDTSKTGQQGMKREYVAAPTVEAFFRLGRSLLSAAGDDAMDGATCH